MIRKSMISYLLYATNILKNCRVDTRASEMEGGGSWRLDVGFEGARLKNRI
jgi:hypothetical protein